jgi:hypothetical protein
VNATYIWWAFLLVRTDRTACCHGIVHSHCIKKRTLKTKRNLKIDSNSNSYLDNPINFDPSWFLRLVSKFWVSTIFGNLMEFPMTSIFRVSPDLTSIKPKSHSRSVSPSVQTGISSGYWQLSMFVTSESLIGLRHMGNRQKAEKISYNISMEGFLRWPLNWHQSRRFFRMFNSAQDRIIAADQLSKVITPKPLVVWGRANNHQKDEEVLSNFCNWVLIRFEPH